MEACFILDLDNDDSGLCWIIVMICTRCTPLEIETREFQGVVWSIGDILDYMNIIWSTWLWKLMEENKDIGVIEMLFVLGSMMYLLEF